MTSTLTPAPAAPTGSEPLLTVRDLSVEFDLRKGHVRVVDHVSFAIHPGEIVGLAGLVAGAVAILAA